MLLLLLECINPENWLSSSCPLLKVIIHNWWHFTQDCCWRLLVKAMG
jgi:hypothetical protein